MTGKHTTLASLLFFAAVLAIALWYHYPRVAHLGPISHHYWRQSDGASLARCYYENGMHFFQPKMHHQVGGDNSGVGEFPILYYTVAALYFIFGTEDAVFRLFNFLLFLGGLYALFRLLLARLGDVWLALTPPLLLFGSPLLAFYGLNFLPNTTALALTLAAAWACNRYIARQQLGWFYLAVGLTLLAGLLKVSILIPFLAYTGSGILCHLLVRRRERWAGYFPHWGHLLLGAGVVLAAVAAWYLWAKGYNERHQASYFFLLNIKPLWSMAENDLAWTNQFLLEEQRMMYFNLPTLILFLGATAALLILPRRMPLPTYLIFLFTLIGSAAFIVLFYNQLAIHHYYFIDIMPLPALVFSLALWMVKRHMPALIQTWTLRFALLLLVLSNVQHAGGLLAQYYQPNSLYVGPQFVSLNKKEALHAFLLEHDIRYPDLAIVIPEVSPNAALYYLNLRGWNISTPVNDDTLRQFVQWGAKYLVILDPDYLEANPLPWATSHPVGVFDGRIAFYDLEKLRE